MLEYLLNRNRREASRIRPVTDRDEILYLGQRYRESPEHELKSIYLYHEESDFRRTAGKELGYSALRIAFHELRKRFRIF